MTKNILTIAGSDSSGGAGIQADIKTISALGGYAMSVITALTAQNTKGVHAVRLIDPQLVRMQIAAIFEDIKVDAVKIGMLGSSAIIVEVAKGLADVDIPIVLDPVMVAKSGDALLEGKAVAALKEHLLPLTTLLTPNIPEAAVLLGQAEAIGIDEMAGQAQSLLSLGPRAVLLKGGHLEANNSPDVLATGGDFTWFNQQRHNTKNTHGTGCTLSAALATFLGKGFSLSDATEHAKDYLTGAIIAADQLNVGTGYGPTNHFWRSDNIK